MAAFRNTLLVGQGARLAGVDPLRGTVLWEVPMASPRGTNEVERLADLVGPVAARRRPGLRTRLPVGGGLRRRRRAARCCGRATSAASQAVGGDAEHVVGADASDRITAWRTATGDVAWTNEKLLYRGLSGAAVVGPVVAFGDSEGLVHFLSIATGEPQLRLPTDGTPVVGTPVLAGHHAARRHAAAGCSPSAQ